MRSGLNLTIAMLALAFVLIGCDQTSTPPKNPTGSTPATSGADSGGADSGGADAGGAKTAGKPDMPEPPKSPEAQAVENLPELPRYQGPGISWVPPNEWKQTAGTNNLRIATIARDEGENNIEIAVTRLGLNFGGLLSNINRWAGQVGLSPLSDEDLDKVTTDIPVDDRTGLLVNLVGPDMTMLVAILQGSESTYFFKLVGPDPIVGRNRDVFLKLISSVKFDKPLEDGEGGGGDDAAGGDAPAQP